MVILRNVAITIGYPYGSKKKPWLLPPTIYKDQSRWICLLNVNYRSIWKRVWSASNMGTWGISMREMMVSSYFMASWNTKLPPRDKNYKWSCESRLHSKGGSFLSQGQKWPVGHKRTLMKCWRAQWTQIGALVLLGWFFDHPPI